MQSEVSWFRKWAESHEGFPSDYLVLDVEATGTDINKDVIIEVGWCDIRNNCVNSNGSTLVDWSHSPLIDPSWLQKRLKTTAQEMLNRGCKPITYDELLTKGIKPEQVFADLAVLISEALTTNKIIIAHNGTHFDFPIIERHLHKILNIKYVFGDDYIWDTGALEKASQLDEPIYESELPGIFAYRVLARSDPGVKWNLHNFIVPKYDLANKYNLDLSLAHSAQFDAYITHLLVEEYRSLAL